jgi:hypothetical protein
MQRWLAMLAVRGFARRFLPITRRLRLQLSSVVHWTSLKRRAARPVLPASLSGQHGHHRIVPQLVVVVEVRVARRDAEHPLADKCLQFMLDPLVA